MLAPENQLRKGDVIKVTTARGTFRYRVWALRIVEPRHVWVLRDRPFEQVVLTACHPPRSYAKRLIAMARLAARKRMRAWRRG